MTNIDVVMLAQVVNATLSITHLLQHLAHNCSSTLQRLLRLLKQGIASRAVRRYAPANGSSTAAKIAADLRPFVDGSAVRTSLVAGGG